MKVLIQFWIAFNGMRTSMAYSLQPSPTDAESPGGKFPGSRYRTTANRNTTRLFTAAILQPRMKASTRVLHSKKFSHPILRGSTDPQAFCRRLSHEILKLSAGMKTYFVVIFRASTACRKLRCLAKNQVGSGSHIPGY